ncbi:MAG: sulfite exporter TauE/SafE family protein [Phycisphaerales bacterium]|nr:sulfite exporter TauE/SafE family protein [Phycisphaerales bacterium]
MSILTAVADPSFIPAEQLTMFIVLAVVAFVTAAFSAIVGMGGGIILLGSMLIFLDPIVAIPIHGAIQMVSNATRATVQRKHLAWSLIWRYAILLLPFGLVAMQVVVHIPGVYLKAFIGVFVLLATWRPKWLLIGTHPEAINANRRFILLGGVVGFLNILVGAVGPFIAPFFLNMNFSRQTIVGTKAACQTCGHIVKILLYGLAGFAFLTWIPLFAIMVPMVILGTKVGSRFLDKVDDTLFVRLFRTVLTAVAGWLILAAFIGG